jgi:hypothetical protein
MAATTRTTSFRLQHRTHGWLDKLSERSGESRGKLAEHAFFNMALDEGIIDEEQREAIDELLERYGDDADVVIPLQERSSHVPVSINGKPTDDLQAAAAPGAVAWFPSAQEQPEWPKEWQVFLWIPNSGITFQVGNHEPPKKIQLKLGELHELRTPPSRRTLAGIRFNREIRGAAGIEVDET